MPDEHPASQSNDCEDAATVLITGRRETDLVERALARDSELARRYDVVRQELIETIQLNETLGAPSARAMEKLLAAIDVEETSGARRQRRPLLATDPP